MMCCEISLENLLDHDLDWGIEMELVVMTEYGTAPTCSQSVCQWLISIHSLQLLLRVIERLWSCL